MYCSHQYQPVDPKKKIATPTYERGYLGNYQR